MKTMIAVLILTAFLVLAACSSKSAKAQYKCVAGPDEQCASDLWYADWARLKGLQDKYKPPQPVADEMVGLATRLQQQVPPGYSWDVGKERFVRTPVPPPPPEVKK